MVETAVIAEATSEAVAGVDTAVAGAAGTEDVEITAGELAGELKFGMIAAGSAASAPGEEGFSRRAPMDGGPFVAAPTDKPPAIGDAQTSIREPRAKPADH